MQSLEAVRPHQCCEERAFPNRGVLLLSELGYQSDLMRDLWGLMSIAAVVYEGGRRRDIH